MNLFKRCFLICCSMTLGTVATLPQTVMARDGVPSLKLPICHKGETIIIPMTAFFGHLGHGDKLSPCPPPSEDSDSGEEDPPPPPEK